MLIRNTVVYYQVTVIVPQETKSLSKLLLLRANKKSDEATGECGYGVIFEFELISHDIQ